MAKKAPGGAEKKTIFRPEKPKITSNLIVSSGNFAPLVSRSRAMPWTSLIGLIGLGA